MTLSQYEPKPTHNHNSEDVGSELLKQLNHSHNLQWLIPIVEERIGFGVQKYGTALNTFNGRNAKRDLAQELIDALFYSYQLFLEDIENIDYFHSVLSLMMQPHIKDLFE